MMLRDVVDVKKDCGRDSGLLTLSVGMVEFMDHQAVKDGTSHRLASRL
jgi:hypothetical protein